MPFHGSGLIYLGWDVGNAPSVTGLIVLDFRFMGVAGLNQLRVLNVRSGFKESSL